MGFFDALSRGLERSREALNEVFYFGGEVDEDFWEDLEDTLVMGDMGAEIAIQVSDDLRDAAAKKNLKTAPQLRRALAEQLDVWGQRAGVPVIKRDRGSDPASVCYDVLDEADKRGSDLVLIDTAGRLHTSPELMRELAKVVNVTRKRAANMAAGPMPVSVVLVIDAATGQNGLNQALEFNEALGLDGIIMTKLDGTAKGGIAMAVAEKLKLPILRVGVGEQVDDLQEFNAKDFCRALVGESN